MHTCLRGLTILSISEILETIKKMETDNRDYEWDLFDAIRILESIKEGIESGEIDDGQST